MSCKLVGVPLQAGSGRRGCDMGPGAFRAAGIVEAISALGITVDDTGDVSPLEWPVPPHTNGAIQNLATVAGWTAALAAAAYDVAVGGLPVFLGGDHSMSAGIVAGVSRRAQEAGRPLFVLWLDAHADFHTLDSTSSGNLHGVPVAYFTGQPGFERHMPPLPSAIDPANVCMLGLRDVDPAERAALHRAGVDVHDMRAIDEGGIARPLRAFLGRVSAASGWLHVSLDVDFLDPAIAPAVGTTVPGGATFREAHLAMEILHDSGLVRSLDLAELNPYLDDRGCTARLMVGLAASLLGRQILGQAVGSAGR